MVPSPRVLSFQVYCGGQLSLMILMSCETFLDYGDLSLARAFISLPDCK